MFKSINPFNLQELASFPYATNKQIENALQLAFTEQKIWKNTSIINRAKPVLKLAQFIKQHHESLAELATLEMGKPLAEAKLEVLKCISACEYYAHHTATFLDTTITTHIDGRKVHTTIEPLGTVLGVFPWNFPYWQIIRSTIPIIMGGNCMLVKPAPNTPQCAIALQKLMIDAGLGDGVVQTIFADEAQIKNIISDDRINACTLTGSEKAGIAVATQTAHHVKKSVLELGGSDPFIVLEDADMDIVMKHAISARFQNNGQSCIASKRYIIHENIATDFLQKVIVEMDGLKVGNPMDDTINIGPLARMDLKLKLEQQVNDSIKNGAKIIHQHKIEHQNTCFYPPTILGQILPSCVAFSEELFGPVLSVFIVQNDDEAIAIANATSFGLGATIWTKDEHKAMLMASKIEAGQVFINAVTRSHTAFPFGGIKKSGYGREMGKEGLLEFCAIKTIWI